MPDVRPFCCGLMCLLAVGCGPGRGLPDLPAATPGAYRLGPGDVVRLITFGEESLTGEFRVSDSGTIALPLTGSVRASGLAPDVLATRVSEALVRGSICAP